VVEVQKIKDYWEKRGQDNLNSIQATTNDIYLRKLEVKTLIHSIKNLGLKENSFIVDAGCGDGYSTIELAKSFPNFKFLGSDYSESMISNAKRNLSHYSPKLTNVSFKVGDVTNFNHICNESISDLIITDRCLINLTSFEQQKDTISQIANTLKKGGYYIAIENFVEGQDNLNLMRRSIDLPEIPIRWHNLFFKESDFKECAEKYFSQIEIHNFSSIYYLATRVIYSGMCKMQNVNPDYRHEIHKLAENLPWFGEFSPIKMVIMKK